MFVLSLWQLCSVLQLCSVRSKASSTSQLFLQCTGVRCPPPPTPVPLTVIWFDSTWTSDFRCWPIICQSCSISPLDGKKSKWLAAGIGLLVRFLKHIHNCISNRKPFIASCPLVSHFIMPTRAAVMQGAQKINNLLAVGFTQVEHFDRYYCVYANKLIANTWRLVMCRTQAR